MPTFRPSTLLALALVALVGCSDSETKSGNNGATNNGATNNGATNNGATNNGATNNGATNNGATNNGTANNGAADAGTDVGGDGGFPTCAESSLTACDANADCPTTHRCENTLSTNEGLLCCVEGARGTKATGEACVEETECVGGACIARNDGPLLCSESCAADTDCPQPAMECHPVLGMCVEASGG